MRRDHPDNHNLLLESLGSASDRFIANNPKSLAQWEKASKVLPGGNTRTVLHYDPFPITIQSGNGTYLESIDGGIYTDFLGEYSAGLYGHSNPKITKALKKAVDAGLSFGAPNQWESLLAEAICKRFDSIKKVRFTNSGTEANLMALGAARAYTSREKIIIFEGGYHGGVLYFKKEPSPVNAPYQFISLPYNDTESVVSKIREHSKNLAAVLIEPMLGSGGCIPAEKDFLKAIRYETEQHNICLIFDEVMTSRNSSGGLQKILEIQPDLTTLGKYLGGGASFGAFGGKSEIMNLWDPTKPNFLAHAGTFNNNTLSMAAGLAGLTEVFTSEIATDLFNKGENFKSSLNSICERHSINIQITGLGSILGIHIGTEKIVRPYAYNQHDLNRLKLIHLEMANKGFLFAQRGYMTLNIAMVEKDTNEFLSAFEEVVTSHKEIFLM